MTRLVSNFIAFQFGWFACVLSAAAGREWLGCCAALAVFALHLAISQQRRTDTWLVPLLAMGGFMGDSLLAFLGVTLFKPHLISPWLCPLWIGALWLCFATTLNGSLRWLQQRPALAALLGALGGPAAYLAGESLGALRLAENRLFGFVGVAILWAIMMPLTAWLSKRAVCTV